MGKRNITIFVDDRTGEDLEKQPKPVHLAFKDRSWNLVLSDKNLKELERVIADFTRHADSVKGKGQGSNDPRNSYGVPVKEVRRWAQNEGRKFIEPAGLAVPGQRGRVDERIHDLHDKHA
jgi:hypothetical protein